MRGHLRLGTDHGEGLTMATTPKTQLGTIACLCCGETIPVKRAENGTLSFPCPWCDFPGYAKTTWGCYERIAAQVKRKPAPASEPAPATAPKAAPPKAAPAPAPKAPTTTTAPAPAPRPRSSIFDIGS